MTVAAQVQARTGQLRERIDRLGLTGNVADLAIDGYTVVKDAAPMDFFAELRTQVMAVAERVRHMRRFPTNLLNEGRVFERAVQIEKLNVLYEYLLGPSFIVSQVSASVKRTTPKTFGIHADMNGYDQPFPGHAVIATSIFCCDDFTAAGGCTRFVAGSHQLRRAPIATKARLRPRRWRRRRGRSSCGTVPCGMATALERCRASVWCCTSPAAGATFAPSNLMQASTLRFWPAIRRTSPVC